MFDIILGLICVWLFTPKEEDHSENNNEEIIRPILMEDFHNTTFDDYGGE